MAQNDAFYRCATSGFGEIANYFGDLKQIIYEEEDEFKDIEKELQQLHDLCVKLESDRINEL